MLKRFLISFLVALFTFIVLPVIFIWGIYGTFLDRDFYKGDFVEDSYDFLIIFGPRLLDLKKFPQLNEDDLRDSFKKVFSKEDLADFFDSIIERFNTSISDIKGDRIKIKIPLNLISKKNTVIAKEVADLLYKKMPKCDKNSNLKNDFFHGKLECIPPNIAQPDFEAQIRNSLDREVFANIPNEFVFDMGVPPGINGDIKQLVLQAFKWFFTVAVLLLLSILFLLGLLVNKPWIKILRIESKTFFIPSFIMSLFLLLLLFSGDIFKYLFYNYFDTSDLNTADTIESVLNLSFVTFAKHLLFYVVPILVISLGLWIASVIYIKKHFDS